MKQKWISIILVSVLLMSLISCGGEMPFENNDLPQTPSETVLPETPETPEPPEEPAPISLEYSDYYASIGNDMPMSGNGKVIVVSSVWHFKILSRYLEKPEKVISKFDKAFFEDHYLLFCQFERLVSDWFGITDVTITHDGILAIHSKVVPDICSAPMVDSFVCLITIPKDIKISNFDNITTTRERIILNGDEYLEFIDSVQKENSSDQNNE